MAAVKKVLIVGGGIAGMSLAIELGRVGIETDLIDSDADWRALGTGITITGPSFRAFAALGLEDEVRAAGTSNQTVRIFQPPETFIGEIGPPITDPPLPNNGGILRPVLHRILSRRTLEAGTRVLLGIELASLTPDGDGVDVVLSDGQELRYDLVVGADGAYSDLRQRVFPHAPSPHYTGQGCFRLQAVRPAEVDCMHMFVGGPVKTGVTPCGPQAMYLFCNVPLAADARWPASEDWIKLKAYLDGYGGVIGDLREGLSANSNIVYRPLDSFLLADPWYRDRVVLIGDAAHSTTPHLAGGAMMAVEDALVLTELLVSSDSLEQGLKRFMQRRFERCQMVVNNSETLGRYELTGVDIATHKKLQEVSWQAMAAPI